MFLLLFAALRHIEILIIIIISKSSNMSHSMKVKVESGLTSVRKTHK